MTQQHPITPPPELVQQWIGDYYGCPVSGELAGVETAIATRAAQWGADQELEACCTQLSDPEWYDAIRNLRGPFRAAELRTARRPQPPSLKEQALEAAQRFYAKGHENCTDEEVKDDFDTIRRALEQLPE